VTTGEALALRGRAHGARAGRAVGGERPGILWLIWQLGALDGTATGVELQIAERSQRVSSPGEGGTAAGAPPAFTKMQGHRHASVTFAG
jgi:hypothetical protein